MVYIVGISALILGCIIGFLLGKLAINNDKLELVKIKEQLKNKDETIKSFQTLENLVKEQFTNIANKAVLEKQAALSEENSKLLEPLNQNIEAFRKRIEDFSKEGVENTQTIKTQIETLLNENKIIKNTANELSNALKENSQARGEFGEIILENILKSSGLKDKKEFGEQGNYITQTSFHDLDNPASHQIRPDAVIFFPDNKHIIVDSKLPLNDFKEFANSENEEEKQKFLKAFYVQIEKMIVELSSKYNNLKGLHTPDFKLMFIPIDGILTYVMSNSKLIEFASTRNIIIVGPSTLIATLKLINYCWTQKNQAENIEQILSLGNSICTKCNILVEKIGNLKNKFLSVENYFEEVMKPLDGKGGLKSLAQKFVDFGASQNYKFKDNYACESEEDAESNVLTAK